MREFTDCIFLKITPEDRMRIREKMDEAGVTNMSAFIRKMAIDGYVIKLDLTDIKEMCWDLL